MLMWKSPLNEDAKIVIGLFLAQILPEKINKMLSPNNVGFIDVNWTVGHAALHEAESVITFSTVESGGKRENEINCFFRRLFS